MKVQIQGKKPVILDPSDYKQGGEAKVWIKGKTVYKIYHDPKHMIPMEKIQELQGIKVLNVIKPKDIILDNRKKPIGFTMDKAVGEALVKLYTTGFRNDKGITNTHAVDLAENIKEAIQQVHEVGCLLVDINDLNIIVENSWIIPNFIDINSWQTPSFPATAINPNIKDWSSKTFTELTDWFSFAIITCYLFVGIHPFRGSHDNYHRSDVEGRMKDHVSIFNPDVRLPRSTRDFSLIPDHYRKWYIELFENGTRVNPPLLPGTVTIVPVKVTIIRSTDNFEIEYLMDFDSNVVSHKDVFGREITRTTDTIWIDKDKYRVNPGVDVVITPVDIIPILAKINKNILELKSLVNNKTLVYSKLNATGMMIINNTLFVTHEGSITEIGFTDMSEKVIVSVDSSWDIMPSSHEVFDGVIYQFIMGKPYLVIPIPKQGENTAYIEKEIPELEGYKIINAKHDHGVVMLTCYKTSKYDLFILRFDGDFKDYHCRVVEDVDLQDPNFVTLANGIVISIYADDTLEVFRVDPTKPEVDKFTDPEINSTMKLCKKGVEVRFFQDKSIYKIRKK